MLTCLLYDLRRRINFPVSFRNRLISSGLEPVLINTEKLCIASYYIKFSTNIKMYNHMRLKPVFSPEMIL